MPPAPANVKCSAAGRSSFASRSAFCVVSARAFEPSDADATSSAGADWLLRAMTSVLPSRLSAHSPLKAFGVSDVGVPPAATTEKIGS